ncbi:hypothetical protein AGMMS49556_04520 [Endomicrobiia bacterium]|nr:hypothetical protein AGMMS49556_04520 [Endomicrobiia bacterium]
MSINKRMIKWNLKNQDGKHVVPGEYFVVIKGLCGNQIKKNCYTKIEKNKMVLLLFE